MENILKNKYNKMFFTFLIVHLLVWSCIGLIRVVLPTDSLEGIWWGSLHMFGNPKHPPLAGWLAYLLYMPFKVNFLIYFFSQLLITGGFIYTYKLAKEFLTEEQAMLSVILLEGCWIYCYITGYYGLNPDTVLLFTLPCITYYFYRCATRSFSSDWIKLGLIVGISCLDKYQTSLLLIGMTIWTLIFKREIFKNKFLYISMMIAFLLFLPHLLWLIKYDFLPLLYFDTKLQTISFINHITEPLLFLFMQIVLIILPIIVYIITKIKYKSDFKLTDKIASKGWFLLTLTLTPLVIHFVIALFSGSNVRPQWGYVFWYMIGIILFYFIPTETNDKSFKFILKSSYIIMFLIFVSFATMLSVEKNYRSRYPVQSVLNDLNSIWTKEMGTQLKYIGGFHEWTFPLTIYGKTHPINIMDTYGYKNIFLDENDLKKSGAMIISRHSEDAAQFTKSACPYLKKQYQVKPKEFHLFVKNLFNQQREYTIYYVIVPPQK